MVRKHLPTFDPIVDAFVCLSDLQDPRIPGVQWLSLAHRWPGYWSKIELFRPGLFGSGRVLYIDLDTVIVGDISEIAALTEPFIGIGDFYRRPPRKKQVSFASGLMSWNAGQHAGIYQTFARCAVRAMAQFRYGDQQWIGGCLIQYAFWEDLVPGQVVSYKVHCQEALPPTSRIVCFHGKPKPAEVQAPWIDEHWNENELAEVLA